MSEFEISQQWFTDNVEKKVLNAAMKGLKQGGEVVVGESQKLAPVLSGTLKRSICVSEGGVPDPEEIHNKAKVSNSNVKVDGKKGEELAIYVSANTPYAEHQHEAHESKSKYLEKGLQNAAGTIPKLIERQIKKL